MSTMFFITPSSFFLMMLWVMLHTSSSRGYETMMEMTVTLFPAVRKQNSLRLPSPKHVTADFIPEMSWKPVQGNPIEEHPDKESDEPPHRADDPKDSKLLGRPFVWVLPTWKWHARGVMKILPLQWCLSFLSKLSPLSSLACVSPTSSERLMMKYTGVMQFYKSSDEESSQSLYVWMLPNYLKVILGDSITLLCFLSWPGRRI